MPIKEWIAAFIARGAIQLSRKYRTIAVPPRLEEGKTYLDLLREKDPVYWKRLEDLARDQIIRRDLDAHIELTHEEFNEWLLQTGRKPQQTKPTSQCASSTE